MSSLHQEYFATNRSTSAPPIVASDMLFAFPTQYAHVFSDRVGSDSELRRVESPNDMASTQDSDDSIGRKMSADDIPGTASLVSRVVDKCISEDEFDSAFYDPVNFVPEFPFSFFMPVNGGVYEQIYLMAKDQIGCRLLQKKLEEKNATATQTIFAQILNHFPELMTDPFGNYLCQKLIEVCDTEQLGVVIDIVSPTIVEISFDAHGTRAVQKLIEICSKTAFIDKIIDAFKDQVVELVKDLNGNHVIQRCLNVIQPPHNQFIYDTASSHVVDIATHRHGCCVLQRCIDAAEGEQKMSIVQCIVDHAVELVQDAFGNYVVQYVLDLQLPEVNGRMAQIFSRQLLELSKQKFSSNVIEKCLQLNDQEIQELMIREVVKFVPQMLIDQYANYGNFYSVVQRALTLATPPLFNDLIKAIKPQMESLRRTHFGKRIYTKLGKKYPSLADSSRFPQYLR